MSEETNSGAPVSETEKPETTSEPSGRSGKNLWMMVAAVVVAILLLSTGLYFFVLSKPGVTVTIIPSPAGVDAGASVALEVTVKSGSKILTDKDAKLRWSVEPNNMGTFDFFTKSKVNLAASSVQQNGTLKCTVDYKGDTSVASAALTIRAPGLDRVSVTPSEMWVKFNTSQVFTAKGISTIGQDLSGLTFTWVASGLPSSAYTITPKNDTAVTFTAKAVAGNVMLNATASYKSVEKTGSATAKVTEFLPVRAVDYRWYDAFKVPFGPWYPRRTQYYSGADYEGIWSSTYPYIYAYFGDSAHKNLYLYSNMRLNISAVNLPNVNMSHPEFLPMFGSTTGGHAVLNWHMQYLDPAVVDLRYGTTATMYNDGWFVNLTGVTTLDKDAAMAVTGMTAADFDGFDTYWATKGLTLRASWQQWIVEDQANGVFDINNMYGTPAQMIGFGLHGQKVGDKVILTIYVDSWGMEALMTRWLRDAFVPTEIWMEGFYMNATIGPQTSNIFIKTDIEYGVYSFMSRNDSKPIWLWKPLHADYFESGGDHPRSEFDPYAKSINTVTGLPYTYMNWNPGSALYGTAVPYDVTPCAWNLSANETMSFTWPSGAQQFELDAAGHVTNVSSEMTINYAEPMPSDHASPSLTNGSIVLDTTTRTLTYSGPLDFWNWSKNQNAPNHQVLRQQWTDIHGLLLPESTPWVEFGMNIPVPPPHIDHYVISGMDDLPLVNQPTSVTVTAYDQFDRVYDGTHGNNYTGTVHFGSNRSSSVTLPADYTFTIGNHGVKTFTDAITFTAAGWFTVSVSNATNASVTGSFTDIYAIPTPQVIDHFTVQLPSEKIAMSRTDVIVTAWNQYGRVFHEYTGTVNLTTNATGTYTLPANYTFLLSEAGVHNFQGGVIWNDAGTYNITVRDISVTTATGMATDIQVKGGPEIRYRVYDMFQDHWMPFWKWRYKGYSQDIILSNTPGNYTMLYNPDKNGYQGIVWAPYRFNITASNLTNVNVHHPEFMPVLDTNRTFTNASANINVYWQYLYYQWWNSTWVPKWQSQPNWYPGSMTAQSTDGWYLGVQYNVTMNRETAQEWLRLPITATNVTAWWIANATSYKSQWTAWLLWEENHRLDIFNAYEFPGSVGGPYARLIELPNGDVRLELDHVSWGYEVLMNRWLMEKGISSHQPYLENGTLNAKLDDRKTNMTLDSIAQYSMHAVKANKSAGTGSAWVFEAIREDYLAPSLNHPKSDYAQFVPLTFFSWNSGDPWYGTEDAYDVTPGWFNLTKTESLTIELPKGDVIAYLGKGVGPNGINNITYPDPITGAPGYPIGGNFGEYNNLTKYGTMSLGYYITNLVPGAGPSEQPLDLNSMYDPVNKTLTIKGPHNFDNSGRGAGNPMYHGAPWIEFNVTYPGSTAIINSAPSPVIVDYGSAVSSEPATVSETMTLMALVSATLVVIAVLAIDMRRKDEC